MRHQFNSLLLVVLAVFAASAVGCASSEGGSWKFAQKLDPRRAMGWKSDEPAEPEIPRRLVATWVDTTMHTPGEKPLRGFGGRLVFFGPEGQESVRVDGELVVYAFDETNRAPHETQPTRRYIFPVDQFVLHESPSRFGPSYSVWLPWDAIGGDQKKISLIARFEPQGGAMIVGEQTAHLLPGIVRPEQAIAQAEPDGDVQLASFADAGAGSAEDVAVAAARRKSTTIDLPIALAAKLAKPRPAGHNASASSTARQSTERAGSPSEPPSESAPSDAPASASTTNDATPATAAPNRGAFGTASNPPIWSTGLAP
ncbi:MAG: hypothetical protein KDA44_17665 [Planctomycetales bacterium]|nr:hypothetical protein [Planctomycetales bacterium]